MPVDLRRRWNHSTHYHRFVLRQVPRGATTALDVGTGDGLLAADLRERVPDVTGLDADAAVLARAAGTGADVRWLLGDVRTAPLPVGGYDVVTSVATVHHLPDLHAGLRRLGELTAPGGRLVVIGCARNARPRDYLADLPGIVQHQVLARTRGYWEHTAPVRAQLPHTYDQTRLIAADALPGARWRRLALFRYAVLWTRPA